MTVVVAGAHLFIINKYVAVMKNSNLFCTICSFVRLLVRSKIFQILVRADEIDLIQKSSIFLAV